MCEGSGSWVPELVSIVEVPRGGGFHFTGVLVNNFVESESSDLVEVITTSVVSVPISIVESEVVFG